MIVFIFLFFVGVVKFCCYLCILCVDIIVLEIDFVFRVFGCYIVRSYCKGCGVYIFVMKNIVFGQVFCMLELKCVFN